MSGDDLHAPLGFGPRTQVRAGRSMPWRRFGYSALALCVAGLSGFTWFTDTGMGGEPFAIAKIEHLAKVEPATLTRAASASTDVAETTASIRAPNTRSTGAEIESDSGVRVVRQGGGAAPGALIIQVPDALGIHLTPAPDRRIVEKGRFGPLPKIGADGARAADVYARPVITAGEIKPGAPRIALVVGGMGLSQQATQNAISKLPGAVTLAFAPYGAELERQAARARDGGHEIILQVPMEPFEAAQSPGPHMLQTTETPEQNSEHLQWLMSRFSGYVGMANFLGAKFTANAVALAPVLREASSRGVFYLDDGGSTQSVALDLGASSGGDVLRADVVIDATQKSDAIEAELLRLEKIARQKGGAIGIATGLPATVEQLARFARGLEKRGVALVPLSSFASTRAVPTAGLGR